MPIEKTNGGLRVSGPMTMDNIHDLIAASVGLLDDVDLVVDLAEVSDVDSSAISLVFEWLRQAQDRNIRLTFSNLPQTFISLATLYGVSELIPAAQH